MLIATGVARVDLVAISVDTCALIDFVGVPKRDTAVRYRAHMLHDTGRYEPIPIDTDAERALPTDAHRRATFAH